MKRTLILTLAAASLISWQAAAFSAGASSSDSTPLWMRYPQISPDGSKIAFAYQGDIYYVPVSGGEATRLTASEDYDSKPIWSNDSRTIAFVSDRFGGMDIFTMSVDGGKATRLTTHSGTETPLAFSPDDKYIYFSAAIQDPASSVMWPAPWLTEVYRVKAEGGRPELVTAATACSISFDSDGKSFMYYNRTSVEDIWRKHHTSSAARDIFYYKAADGTHRQISRNPGEDRDPVFTGDGQIAFLSERDGGSFNVYKATVVTSGDSSYLKDVTALTSFKKHPVRFLSRATDGTLCFGYQGEIYTLPQGGKPAKVNISITNDNIDMPVIIRPGSVREAAFSDDGKEIILQSRGEVFATTGEYSTTKQITHTAAAEEGVTVSPDGKTIVYASERTGCWNLYKAALKNEDELHFAYATLIDEEPLLKDDGNERMYPSFSPDGKEIAFIENRRILKVLNLESGKVRQITDGSQHYGEFQYDWSPDGKWFALTLITNRRDPYSDIGIVSAVDGGRIHNVTNSGYIDHSPQWVMDGNAIIFISNRLGLRSHASWGSQDDVFIAFMNRETYDRFNMSEEEFALYKEKEKAAEEKTKEAEKAEKDKNKKGSDKKDSAAKTEGSKDIEIDFAGIEHRIMRLTPMSSTLASAALTEDGESLYFLSAFEEGFDLWELSTRTGSVSLIKKLNTSYASLAFDKDGKNLYILGYRPQIMNMGSKQVKPVNFNMTMELDRAAERAYMFDHVFRQQEKKFYTDTYHGVNLEQLRKDYKPFLKHINNNYDFSEMLAEILGELNVSHTGSGYSGRSAQKVTPELGLLFDMEYTGDGLRIDEVLDPGPFSVSGTKVKPGVILEAIDGSEIKAGEDWFPLINGKTGDYVLFSFYDPASKERWDMTAKPISRTEQNEILYQRWVRSRAAEVDSLSGGRLGYVHIRSMGDDSYRDVYADILGKYNLRDGIVIDTRYNGGGRLHEDIEILFSGEKYLEQVIQGTVVCDMPSRRYNKHSIMLVCESNYSNAHGTPWVYRYRGIGSIVGMPVPGTMTSVNWETLQDPTMYFGIPVIGYRTRDGHYLENSQLEPDFLVRNKAEEVIDGRDEQLEVAVRELLRQIDADTDRW
ncbi:MAG TPA: peptidase S41 [Candidatus Coprenecus stercoravium]|uniref:Tricorn protease homolog n=1 Tax=Candidatus Coprenecus stercoravium TaxID=2840735 RepID=A0A9D2GNT2_9BACT|nr:peptidase S41 [Candidatus Coprenecus stercoravium]